MRGNGELGQKIQVMFSKMFWVTWDGGGGGLWLVEAINI